MDSSLLTQRDAQHLRTFQYWMIAVAVAFVAATYFLAGPLLRPHPAAWLIPALTLFLGIMALRAYVLFLREADELLRKIHLEALAVAFGAGAVFMPVYRLCERLGAPKLDSVDPLIVILLAWSLGLMFNARRYSGEEAR